MIEFNVKAKESNPIAMLIGTEAMLLCQQLELSGCSILCPEGEFKEIIGCNLSGDKYHWQLVVKALQKEGFSEEWNEDMPPGMTQMQKGKIKFIFAWTPNTYNKLLAWNSLMHLHLEHHQYTPIGGSFAAMMYANDIFKIVLLGWTVVLKNGNKGWKHSGQPSHLPDDEEEDDSPMPEGQPIGGF